MGGKGGQAGIRSSSSIRLVKEGQGKDGGTSVQDSVPFS